MTYGRIIYMITYLVSLETNEISYSFNINKYHKDEGTPRLIPVEINLYCVCSGFRQIFKTPGKSSSRTNIFTNLVGKNVFQPERFLNEANHGD